jgi:hypothetical protein
MRTLVLPLVLSFVGGCQLLGTSCTLMYAPDGVEVELLADDWAPGAWEVEVNGEFCFLTLPDPDDLDCSYPLRLELTEDGAGIQAVILTEQTPALVDIVLLRDGEEVDAVSVEPVYQESEPNGKNCGERSWADEAIEVDVG